MSTSDTNLEKKRFRGNWIPVIHNPVPVSFSSSLVLEKVADIHSKHGLELTNVNETEKTTLTLPQPEDLPPIPEILAGVIGDELVTDAELAKERVNKLKESHPDLDRDALTDLLIRNKCKQTFLVGLCSAGPALLLPGWGNLASILFGTLVDVSITTKLEVDLALEIAALYELDKEKTYDRKNFLLSVSGLEGLIEDDEEATRQAGERLAVRTSEEVGKRSLLRFVPVIGATIGAGTNVVGCYVCGKRAQVLSKGGKLNAWREDVKNYVVPKEISQFLTDQVLLKVPSSISLKFAEASARLGKNAKNIINH